MKFFGYFMGIVIFLFGIFTLIEMLVDGVDSNYTYLIPSIFILIGLLFMIVIRWEKDDIY